MVFKHQSLPRDYCPSHIFLGVGLVKHEFGISHTTIVDCYNFSRSILENFSEQIGGPGKIVEIDESKFGKRKFHKGRKVDGVWVFGGLERDSKKCFFKSVVDRTVNALVP